MSCEICLSEKRNLCELGHYSSIYQLLLNGCHNNTSSNYYSKKVICWECKALFKKLLLFQNKIKMVELNRNKMIEQKSMSTLSISKSDNTHVYIYEDDIVRNIKIIDDIENIDCFNEEDDESTGPFEPDVSFVNEEQKLKPHRTYKKSEQVFTCDYCKRNFKRKISVLNHIQLEHLALTCNVCRKTFNRYKTLKLHVTLKHTELEEDKQYCVECDKYFFNTYYYKKHIRNTRSHTPKKKKTNIVAERKYCEKCKKYYKNISSYKTHLYKVNHDGKESIKCPKCDKPFKHKEYLKDHFDRVHLKNYKLNCNLCEKKFVRKGKLNMHVRTVHDKINKYHRVEAKEASALHGPSSQSN